MGCGASAAKGDGKYVPESQEQVATAVPERAQQEQESYRRPKDAVARPDLDFSSPQKASSSPCVKTEGLADESLELPHAGCLWWASHAGWIQHKAAEVLAAYNYFFEHIGLRKGWRTAPFGKEEVQAPFQAAAEVVTVVRARLDEQKGGGVVLRQVEGSAMSFLWGWSPERSPGSCGEALEEFFRGLVFATLSDGRGLVEGLDANTVEHYVSSHPIIVACRANPSPKNTSSGARTVAPADSPIVLPDATPAAEAEDSLFAASGVECVEGVGATVAFAAAIGEEPADQPAEALAE